MDGRCVSCLQIIYLVNKQKGSGMRTDPDFKISQLRPASREHPAPQCTPPPIAQWHTAVADTLSTFLALGSIRFHFSLYPSLCLYQVSFTDVFPACFGRTGAVHQEDMVSMHRPAPGTSSPHNHKHLRPKAKCSG